MKKRFLITVFAGVGFLLSAGKVSAQTFSFTPKTATVSADSQFTVTVGIDVGTKKTIGADLKITYDSTLLGVISVERGDFFSRGGLNLTSGLIYASYGVDTTSVPKTGSGTYAVMTLKGKKAGTAVLTVNCSSQSTDSNIWDETNKDIINCTAIQNPGYTFTGSVATPSATVAPSLAVATTATATPTPPVSGITLPTFFSLGLGLVLTVLGLSLLFRI